MYERRSQVIKQRALRHNRLIKLIKNYTLSEQQQKKLQKIKINTMMEINIRYLRCDHNRHYKFPFTQSNSDEEDNTFNDPYINKKELILYNLHSQNIASFSTSPEKRQISLSSSRKIISLQINHSQTERQKLLRLKYQAQKYSPSSKNLIRKNSLTEKMRNQGRKIRLPELKNQRSRENLKTESKMPQQEHEIKQVIGKKLLTQASQGRSKMLGVQKYLRRMQANKESEVKSGFKKRLFLPPKLI